MAHARVPLVAADHGAAPDDCLRQQFTLTAAGRDVLDRRADAVHLNGIDRWRGGVRLAGAESDWRWDPSRRTLLSWDSGLERS
jgi:hypothetical protein